MSRLDDLIKRAQKAARSRIMVRLFTADDIHIDLKNDHYIEWLNFLRKSDNWSDDQMNDYVVSEANRVLKLALSTKGYQSHFASHGVTRKSLSYLDQLNEFPTIDKDTLRANINDFTLDRNDLDYVTTGGSTGIPLGIYRSPVAFAKELASKAHQYHRIGWHEGDKQIVLRGLPIENEDKFEFFPQFNELRMSSYYLTDEIMQSYVKLIEEYRPSWLRCYPSSAQIFANWLNDNDIKLPQFKGALCASENLYDFQKTMIADTFGGRCFSHYGNYELAGLAGFSSLDDNYHVMRQYGVLELVNETGQPVNKAGNLGEIIGTSFLMDGTIIFRYRTVDFARLSKASSPDLNFQTTAFSKIEGRLQDFVVTKDNRLISMTALNMHDDIFDGFKQFQLEQHKIGEITFNYIPAAELNDIDLLEIRNRLSPKLNNDIEIKFQKVDSIEVTKRGKHRFLKQHLPLSFGDGSNDKFVWDA